MNPDRAARLHGAVDRDRGELFRLVPMRPAAGPRTRAGPDPDRPQVEFTGTWAASPALGAFQETRDRASSLGLKPGHQGEAQAVLVRQDAFEQRPRDDDVVIRLATGERCAIVRVAATGFGRYVLVLNG